MRLICGMWLISFLLGLWLVQLCSAALPNGAHDFDDFSSQEPTNGVHGKQHGNRVFNRAIRGPQGNSAAPRISAQTKTQPPTVKTTTSAPVQNEPEKESNTEDKPELEDESNSAKDEISSTTTSTEASRKTVGGVVRPFRSNKDLLDSLKRRRQMQAQNGYTVVPPVSSSSTTEKPQAKNNYQNNRKVNNLNNKTPTPSADQTSTGSQKKSTANRRYNVKANSVSSTPTSALANEAIAEESNVATQSSRTRTFPKTRRTS